MHKVYIAITSSKELQWYTSEWHDHESRNEVIHRIRREHHLADKYEEIGELLETTKDIFWLKFCYYDQTFQREMHLSDLFIMHIFDVDTPIENAQVFYE